ncbi:bifunctional metallophosphatase/5'-nucleotidase [Caldibacillus lycopersici]|uniref:Bifunctional metallophosphatase/5'-nucleotidase n=1 Tax=Perspicuibacillus lycopersici TaxID=1325689 RepID=A0AAE3LLV4_9BACI|nr:bifunctional UDP-sugar hydrolase/5'-nucleotidase [Perspicuibacillus lycopersici]MCU9612835.1 bifunctional metallophosphatase/5'-nucleotidase [Perspicuibacillus lycopersici]
MIEKIYIYHTNDVHSHFQYWPRIHEEVTRQRKLHAARQESMFVFDIGDHIDRVHPYTEGTLGKGNIDLLNAAGYDAVTIGNNEGITLPHEALDKLYENAQFDCVVANLFAEDGTRPNWAKPYQVFETDNHTKIGLIGVTINFQYFYEPLHWKVTDPFEALQHWVPIVKEQTDIVIILSHLGLSDDQRIAKEFPGVHLVLGGHTHHVLMNGELVEDCLLACTGKYGNFLGKVELHYDVEKRKMVEKKAILMETMQLPNTIGENQQLKAIAESGKQLLNKPIADLPYTLETDWYQDTELNQLLCSALTEWCQADCSFINAGLLVAGLEKGIVTEYDIHQICPHPINPCIIRLPGAVLKEVLAQTFNDPYISLQLKGFGFRGKVFGKMIYDQITFNGKGAAMEIYINGEAIDSKQLYTVATIDIFAFARFYPELTRSEKQFVVPEFMRDLLKWKLSNMFPLT